MLVWLLPGLWALAGLAHLLHRWDRRHRRDFLTVYLRTLAVLDVWRGTTYALAATTSGVLLHLTVGGLTLTPRLISPVILLSTLIVRVAGAILSGMQLDLAVVAFLAALLATV